MKPAQLSIVLIALAVGCSKPTTQGPPDVKYGHVECAECGMIVSAERHAAAMVPADGEPSVFDDIGCMVSYEVSHPQPESTRRWVHDVESAAWLNVVDARIVEDDSLHTPMGSHLAARGLQASNSGRSYLELVRAEAEATASAGQPAVTPR